MEIVAILRVLWARKALVAVGAVLALGLAVKLGGVNVASSGVASTRVVLDTPKSQLIETAPDGADTLAWRAGLLTGLLASDPVKANIARVAGIPVAQLSVIDLSLAAPTVPASLPKAAAEAATISGEPYVLNVRAGDLPIISLWAAGPDRTQAARIVRAATDALAAAAPPQADAKLQRFVVDSAAPIRSRQVAGKSRLPIAIAAAIFVFGLWCGGVTLLPGFARLWRAIGPPGGSSASA